MCGYKRVSPASARAVDTSWNLDLAQGDNRKVPICRDFMERTGIEPVTSGLQSPVGCCGRRRGWLWTTAMSRDFLRSRRGDERVLPVVSAALVRDLCGMSPFSRLSTARSSTPVRDLCRVRWRRSALSFCGVIRPVHGDLAVVAESDVVPAKIGGSAGTPPRCEPRRQWKSFFPPGRS